MKNFEAGTYRLLNDVLNPEPDARIATVMYRPDWHKVRQWNKGQLFFVRHYKLPGSEEWYDGVCAMGAYTSLMAHEAGFKALIPQLFAIKETPSLWLKRFYREDSALDVLDKLVADGIVSMDEVKATFKDELP